MRKIISTLLTAALLCLVIILPAQARELPDPECAGSITISLCYDGQALNSCSLTIRRVGQLVVGGSDDQFGLIGALQEEGPALDDLMDPSLAQALAVLADEKQLPALTAEIKDGLVIFPDLETGLYLVTQSPEDATEGFAPIQPFLISLPQWMDETYVYDVTASPKVPLVTEPTEPTQPPEPSLPPDPSLPQTGQLNWPIPLLVVLGLGLFASGWLLCSDRRQHG